MSMYSVCVSLRDLVHESGPFDLRIAAAVIHAIFMYFSLNSRNLVSLHPLFPLHSEQSGKRGWSELAQIMSVIYRSHK